MSRPAAPFGLCIGLLLGLLANACGDGSGGTTPEACQMVIDACHEKDDGSDTFINDCHAQAHAYDDAACSADLQACIDACNAAPPIDHGTGDDHHGTDDHGESTGHGETSGTGGHDGSTSSHEGSTSHGHESTSTAASTGADDSSEASCMELGSICHDAADEFGMMCHDIGHDGDEAACAKVWVECIAHCS